MPSTSVGGQPPALVVLDIVGTTVLDRGEVEATLAEALQRHGIRLDADRFAEVRGASKRDAIASLVASHSPSGAPPSVDEVYQTFRRLLEARYAEGVETVPGAAEAVARLRAAGVAVALNTGLERRTVDAMLRSLPWAAEVDAVVCGDEVARGRPAPDLIHRAMQLTGVVDPARVASVGDTALDVRAGAAAGVGHNIAVLSGAHDRDRLSAEGPTLLLASVAELPAVWWG